MRRAIVSKHPGKKRIAEALREQRIVEKEKSVHRHILVSLTM